MEKSRSIMRLVIKLLVFSSLFYTISAGSNGLGPLGYQFLNVSRMPHCFSLPNNNQCPTMLINYNIPDLDSGRVLTNHLLTTVNATLNGLQFFSNVNDSCRKAVREYACSNSFPICRPDPTKPLGIAVNYDANRTRRACVEAKASCPKEVVAVSILKCLNIMENPMEFMTCTPLPDVPGDLCAKTNYKYPLAYVKIYPYVANIFNHSLNTKLKFLKQPNLQQFIDIYCQINSGPICSDDEKIRIYKLSRQQCAQTMQNILPGQAYFQIVCNLFPDETTAKRVPFPSGVNNNSVGK